MTFRKYLLQSWRHANGLTHLLWPLTLLYRFVYFIRKKLYEFGFFSSYRAPVPVVVVGNLTVGGTGKTPLVIYLVELLREQGYQPGVISRGYSGGSDHYPLVVDHETAVEASGDEPALIVRRTNVPMVVGPDRKANIELLLEQHAVDVVVSDDGLQHLALQRDVEVCLMDETTESSNTYLLPAGPYREPLSRLGSVDLIVRHKQRVLESCKETCGENKAALLKHEAMTRNQFKHLNDFSMVLNASQPQRVCATDLSDQTCLNVSQPLMAIAGIGNPQRFFKTCEQLGYTFESKSYPDHYQFKQADFNVGDQKPILMTEKDAVKCTKFANDQLWFLPVDANLSDGFSDALARSLNIEKQ